MNTITIKQLRTNLCKIIDQVIQTGEPIEIEHKGNIVKIVRDKPKNNLSKLTKHPDTMIGVPEDFVHVNWEKYDYAIW